MTTLRSAWLLLFLWYCKAKEECEVCHDPSVSIPRNHNNFEHILNTYLYFIIYLALSRTHRTSRWFLAMSSVLLLIYTRILTSKKPSSTLSQA